MPEILYVDDRAPLSIAVFSLLKFSVKAKLRLETDGSAEWEPLSGFTQLSPGENHCTYQVRPLKRGIVCLKEVVVRIQDFLGMWEIEKRFAINAKSRAFPNLRGVGKFAIKMFGSPEIRTGLKIERYRGEGSEFDSLREYIPGYDIRTIDWKASARRVKLVCREFRAEKNHDIIIALDCGYLMAAEFQGLTKLDYAINALLTLAYAAVKTGDRVGFLGFDESVHTFIRPQGKANIVQQISNSCAELSYEFKATNFVVSMEYLLAQQKKRALVILFTDFMDSISAEVMKDYLFLISRRHLVLLVSIRDPFLDTYLRERPEGLVDLHRKAACYDLRNERWLLFQELQRMGIYCLDLSPDNISIPVLNKYIEIRRRELI